MYAIRNSFRSKTTPTNGLLFGFTNGIYQRWFSKGIFERCQDTADGNDRPCISALDIARAAMVKQYDKNIKLQKYSVNDEVWLERKTFKNNENKKLAPRKCGPWTIIATYPNGVNFKIKENSMGNIKVAHHNRLTPIKVRRDDHDSSSEEDSSSTEGEMEDTEIQVEERRYPLRDRQQRVIPGTISWDVLESEV